MTSGRRSFGAGISSSLVTCAIRRVFHRAPSLLKYSDTSLGTLSCKRLSRPSCTSPAPALQRHAPRPCGAAQLQQR
eukprot:scaffold1954_cov268-Pinguiococcus_pyrenoidosus.AAC.294